MISLLNHWNISYEIGLILTFISKIKIDHVIFIAGTKYFAVIALKAGRHRMAILAMITLGISAICVRSYIIS